MFDHRRTYFEGGERDFTETINAIVELDYDGERWSARGIAPEAWRYAGAADGYEEICELAYSAASGALEGDVSLLYRHTDAALARSVIEDPAPDDCGICHPGDSE